MPVNKQQINQYFATLADHLKSTAVTSAAGEAVELDAAINQLMAQAVDTHARGNKLIFVGNGGSSAIASHMATDYAKNGGVCSLALNDSAMLTCLGNDLGYERVFAKQIELHARPRDLLIAISSSGRSPNIINAVRAACLAGCSVVTFSGFTPDNPLRKLGDVNFYLSSAEYGFVEIGHLTLCHLVLDFICANRVQDQARLAEGVGV